MAVRAIVRCSHYQDSMALMRLAEALRALPGVREAAALMGTPANHEMLAVAGLAIPEAKDAAPGDLMIVVSAETDEAATSALDRAAGLLEAKRRVRETAGRAVPRTLESALRQQPDANLVAVSVPGPYAKLVALRALRRGLHVFLFSDNVPLADEIELKQAAARRGLLCMGPDCGTAYLGGVGLGFANEVAPGRIGCVAASGTGLQAVASHLAALGEGISHGIGVGGRDLSAEVGGIMTTAALEALAANPRTEVVVLISKPPAPGVMAELEAAIRTFPKPVVVCCLGAAPRGDGRAPWVRTLEDAAHAAAALARRQPWTARAFTDPAAVRTRLESIRRGRGETRVLGLYTGGTLAWEARLLLEPLLGTVGARLDDRGHRVIDLGGDEFTIGRPHPMLDPEARAARVRQAGRTRDVGVLLVDLVLGRAAHPDPARPLAAAIHDARRAAEADGRALVVAASVVGTERDPQGLARQVTALEAAGAHVLPSNAQAARFAALAVKPDLAPALLGGTG
ncbi:MAG: acyl-CoA synthetase FdrA [Candidatus Rokubacteria bacterium]|nr:acyl-CoA synthetase FdrA [Candidatus Rokubacteria bacterium]